MFRDWLNANVKVGYDNALSHQQMVNSYAELALKGAIEFQEKMNNEYLQTAGLRQNQALENSRYLLDWLTSMYPPEAAGMGTYMSMLINALKENPDLREELNRIIGEMGKNPAEK